MTPPRTAAPRRLRIALTIIMITAAGILAFAPAGADTHISHGWTYDTATGVVSASADAWHKPSAKGPIEVTLWRRDTHDGTQTRLTRTTIPNLVPVTITLGVIPPDACGGQWDVRASDGTWLAGQQWQTPGCGPTTSTTSTTTPPTTTTTTEPSWSSTTTSPPQTSTTSTEPSSSKTTTPVSSTTVADTSKPGTPPAAKSNASTLPQTGDNPAWVGFVAPLGLLVMAAGMGAVAWSKKTSRNGKYRR